MRDVCLSKCAPVASASSSIAGLPAINRESWQQVARATAAHSTVTFNNASSYRFAQEGPFRKLIGVPVVDRPSEIAIARDDNEEVDPACVLSHDGYSSRFGIIHQRSVMLTAGGAKLEGEDVFTPTHGEMLPPGRARRIRDPLHLHPSIKASRIADGHGAMLVLPNKDVWTFDGHEDRVELEESVFLGGTDGPRRARADRDLRPCAAGVAGALDFHLRRARIQPPARPTTLPKAASRRTSQNCRCKWCIYCRSSRRQDGTA